MTKCQHCGGSLPGDAVEAESERIREWCHAHGHWVSPDLQVNEETAADI